jgi:hypothetical protein
MSLSSTFVSFLQFRMLDCPAMSQILDTYRMVEAFELSAITKQKVFKPTRLNVEV